VHGSDWQWNFSDCELSKLRIDSLYISQAGAVVLLMEEVTTRYLNAVMKKKYEASLED